MESFPIWCHDGGSMSPLTIFVGKNWVDAMQLDQDLTVSKISTKKRIPQQSVAHTPHSHTHKHAYPHTTTHARWCVVNSVAWLFGGLNFFTKDIWRGAFKGHLTSQYAMYECRCLVFFWYCHSQSHAFYYCRCDVKYQVLNLFSA